MCISYVFPTARHCAHLYPKFSFLGNTPNKSIQALEKAVENIHKDLTGMKAMVGVLRKTLEEGGITFEEESEEET